MSIDIKTLIDLSGGPEAIAQASRKGAAKKRSGTKELSVWAVRKWLQRGIPDDHWDLLSELSGQSIESIYRANQSFRRQARGAAA